MSSVLDDYDVTASAVERLIRRAGKDDWDKPTPCTDWSVRGLVNHIVRGNLMLSSIMLGEPAPDRSLDHLGDDPAEAYRASVHRFRDAAAAPGALEQRFPTPLGEQSGRFLVHMRINELLVHGWDLARALGLPPDDLPDGLAEEGLAMWRERMAAVPRGKEGPFATEQPAPPDASPIDRLAAFLGRRLDWPAT